jgi:hypothetical protein
VRSFTVRLAHNGETPRSGVVRLELSQGRSPAAHRYAFDAPGQARTFTFQVRRPAVTPGSAVRVRAVAEDDGGRQDTVGVEVIEYPHIRPTQSVTTATGEIRLIPLKFAGVRQVGYVRGASDRVPEALAAAGFPVTVLSAGDLAAGDLSRFDAIVIGSRAYETDSALVRHNSRVIDYAKNGGLVVVQYQQYAFVRGGHAGLPLTIASPHDRVTDETVPVTVLEPGHRAFRTPNPIDAGDWAGWPQERGLYFANTWDPAYQPLLEMHDPDMPPLRGGLLVGKLGSGTYVYTGLSFFRALPAGVPGAYKLFLNLLSLNAKDVL